MKKSIAFILGMLGLNMATACGSQNFSNADVEAFAQLIVQPGVQLVDVRTAEEFAEGHLEGALNIDVKLETFIALAKERLDTTHTVAVYCRSGRRSAHAAELLSAEGFKVVNLSGGIMAWSKAGRTVTKDAHEVDAFTTKSGKSVEFYALMHASIRIVFDGREIQVDPVRRLGDRSTDYSAMPKADYLLVTHEHGDHFDRGALAELKGDKTRFITNRRCADMAGEGEVMANGDRLTLEEGITVEAVPAYNTTEGRTQFHPKGRDNGYILTIDELRIYIAGDTEDIPEMADIKDIDIAFLPCNQPYTMTTGQLEKAARTIRPRTLFPYHYGQTDVSHLGQQLSDTGIDVRIRHYE